MTVTRLRYGDAGVDAYGDRVDGAVDELAIGGCSIAPRTAGEDDRQGRQGVPIGWTLYGPYGADIAATDHVRLPDGSVCEVDGQPARWEHNVTGRRPGLEVALRRQDG